MLYLHRLHPARRELGTGAATVPEIRGPLIEDLGFVARWDARKVGIVWDADDEELFKGVALALGLRCAGHHEVILSVSAPPKRWRRGRCCGRWCGCGGRLLLRRRRCAATRG